MPSRSDDLFDGERKPEMATMFKHFMRAAQRGAWCGFARVVPLAPAWMAGERSLDTATRGK
jgi:hypothetical protein